MKPLLSVISAVMLLASSCQFYTPELTGATMDTYVQEMCDAFLLYPATLFADQEGKVNWEWVEKNISHELSYTFTPEVDGCWRCTIKEDEWERQDGYGLNRSAEAVLEITGEPGRRTFTLVGWILEEEGYKTDLDGTVTGSRNNWNGSFRLETSLNGRALDWGEAVIVGDGRLSSLTTGTF